MRLILMYRDKRYVCLYRDELRDLTHVHNYEEMMTSDTLRYDNEHDF